MVVIAIAIFTCSEATVKHACCLRDVTKKSSVVRRRRQTDESQRSDARQMGHVEEEIWRRLDSL